MQKEGVKLRKRTCMWELPQGAENRGPVVSQSQNTWQREGEGDDRECRSSAGPRGYETKREIRRSCARPESLCLSVRANEREIKVCEINQKNIVCLTYKCACVCSHVSGQTANEHKCTCAFCAHCNPRSGSRGKAVCERVSWRSPPPTPGPGWNVTALQPGPQQLSSARLSQAQRRHHRFCCWEALVSCSHSQPPRLCYCWLRQRGTQLRTRGLRAAFLTSQSLQNPEKALRRRWWSFWMPGGCVFSLSGSQLVSKSVSWTVSQW